MFFRTALHYAAMNDSSKVIEAVFMAFKAAGKPVSIHGQQIQDGNSPMKNPPPATTHPYKGMFDDMGPIKKPAKKV